MPEEGDGLRLVEVADPDPAEWEALVSADPLASVLHRPAVQRIVASGIRDATPRWWEVRDHEGQLAGGLPLIEIRRFGLSRVVSGASGLYGGPVIRPDRAAAAGLLAEAFESAGGWRVVERELVWGGVGGAVPGWTGARPLPTAVLPVDGAADFEDRYVDALRPARRKERRRLLKKGYRAEEGGEFLEEFFPIYSRRSAGWGTPPVPREVLARLLASGKEWVAFVVRDAGGAVAGAHVCVDLGDELFAWLGTTERVEGGSLATLLVEAELRWCHARGRSRLNLGTSSGLAGVSGFKRWSDAVDEPRWIIRWRRGRGYR